MPPSRTFASRIPRARAAPAAPGRQAGFSLVELLVATAITFAVVAGIFWLFASTRSATRAVMDRSAVNQAALQVNQRLRPLFARMAGPDRVAGSPAGVLMVIPGVRSGRLPRRHGTPGVDDVTVAGLRCDQLVFFTRATDGTRADSLTLSGVSAPESKVWIGPLRPADGDPADACGWMAGLQATLLVDPDPALHQPPARIAPEDPLCPAGDAARAADAAPVGLAELADWMRAPLRSDADLAGAFAAEPRAGAPWAPTVDTRPLADGRLTPGDVSGTHRILAPRCSEIVVQCAGDFDPAAPADPRHFNGLVNTLGADDFSGPVRWIPDGRDVQDPARPAHAVAGAPQVFRAEDDQPRLWHLGYYQGDDPLRYRMNRHGDLTPYPAVGRQEFGDALRTRAAYDAAMDAYASGHHGHRPGPTIAPPQSRWPYLVRIRLRLHDERLRMFTQDDDAAANGRDDDGDGRVDNPEEALSAGCWFEFVFAVPYPHMD